MVPYNCITHRAGVISALFSDHAQCHIPRRCQVNFCRVNKLMGGHSMRGTSPSSALFWPLHVKDGLSLCMCLRKTIFWLPTWSPNGSLSHFLFLLCRARVSQLLYFLGGWAWEFPGSERDESERRVIQKVTQSEQQCCPLAELSLFLYIPWDAKLVALLSCRMSDQTT